jgi:methionyl aminopeptidase
VTKTRPNDPCWCGSGTKYKRCHMHKDRLAALDGDGTQAEPDAVGRPPVRPVQKGTVSPRRSVPPAIMRPDYADIGKPQAKAPDAIKSPVQIAGMRKACTIAREVLEAVSAKVAPGVTTESLDAYAHELCVERGVYPSPLNYFGYPKAICTSVNEVICHGIPDSRALVDGDIVNVDVTVYCEGFHGDCSQTVLVGEVDEKSRKLVSVTRECLYEGIKAVQPGGQVRDIGRAIERVAARQSFGVVRAFVGHGIGETFHMEPQVPHYYDHAARFELRPGMTFTIEPMINMGTWRHTTWDDNWTAVTADLLRSAQFEHTILVTERGVEVLTLPPGEAQPCDF